MIFQRIPERGVVESIYAAATEANINIIAGDTKVVQNGKADELYINTTGVGIIPDEVNISGTLAKPGDVADGGAYDSRALHPFKAC
jgi:hydrogenase maturation factor